MTKNLIETIFGVYQSITYTQNVYDPSGAIIDTVDVIPAGMAGVDWQYVLGVVVFIVVLYSILRIIGSVIHNV